jgi:hypothetical protein
VADRLGQRVHVLLEPLVVVKRKRVTHVPDVGTAARPENLTRAASFGEVLSDRMSVTAGLG